LGERFVVLERPPGDEKHLVPGWWETFDTDGARRGTRHLAGFYPDDLAAAPDGRFLFVLSSGRAEGDQRKPLPMIEVLSVERENGDARAVGRLTFDPSDDPERLIVSTSGRFAAVSLAKSKRTAAIDISTRESPQLIGRTRRPPGETPYVSSCEE